MDAYIGNPKFFRRIFESVPDAVLVVHIDDNITAANPAFEAIFGYTTDEVSGREPDFLFANPADYRRAASWHNNPQAGREPLTFEYRASDGRRILGETTGSILFDDNGSVSGFVVIIRDVTERSQAQRTIEALYDITSSGTRDGPSKIRAMLQRGLEHFGMTHAIVSRITGEVYEVIHAITPGDQLAPGTIFNLGDTYCAHTLQADGPTGFHHSSQSPIKTHPCFRNFGLESYIGTPLLVEGQRYGTVNFSSLAPRRPFTDTDRRIIGLFANWIGYELALQKQVAALQEARDQMAALALKDELTGISNRRDFMELSRQEWERFRRHGRPFSFLMMDADYFKRINDTYGHDAGDQVLREIAGRISGIIRTNDIFGRLGGEEFALTLPDTSGDAALCMAGRVRDAVSAEPVVLPEGTHVEVTLSIGVAAALPAYGSLEEVMSDADQAVYQAKKAGRDQVVKAWRSP